MRLLSGAGLVVGIGIAADAGLVVELGTAATEFLDATRTQITRTRRRTQFRRARVLVALSVLVAALVAGGIAVVQASTAQRERGAAIHQRDVATQQQRAAATQALLAHAAQLRTSQIGQSLLLGIAAMRVSPSNQARSALISTLIGSHSPMTLPGNGTQALAVAFSPDGHKLFTGYKGPSITVHRVADVAPPLVGDPARRSVHTCDGGYRAN